jgi:Saf4/Yju2 protein
MGDRKVSNKYIPPDFDPSLVPRGKKLSAKDGTVPVRMMLPFSLQCSTCKTFLYRGRKFNSKKEPMGGPDGHYLGIQRFRFYIKCTHCSRPITFCTDPKNADYELESGGTRNYEIHKDKDETEQAMQEEAAMEKKMDPLKALENRVLDSQREMADLDNLEQIKAKNAQHVVANAEALLQRRALEEELAAYNNEAELSVEDEALLKSIRFGQGVKRLTEQDERLEEERRQKEAEALLQAQKAASQHSSANNRAKETIMPKITVVKRKRVDAEAEVDVKSKKPSTIEAASSGSTQQESAVGLSSLLGGYGSDSD